MIMPQPGDLRSRLIGLKQPMPAAAVPLTSIANMLNMSSKYIGQIFLQDTGIKYCGCLTDLREFDKSREAGTTPLPTRPDIDTL